MTPHLNMTEANGGSLHPIEQLCMEVAVENAADLVFALNADCELLYCNHAYRKTFAARFGRMPTPRENLAACHSPAETMRMHSDWARAAQGEKVMYEHQQPVDAHTAILFRVSVCPVYGAGGQVIGASYFCRDITEKTQAIRQAEAIRAELLDARLQERRIETKALLAGEERERRRLGCELHDGLGQMLNVLKMHLARESVSPQAARMLDEIMQEVIRMNADLMPLVLQDFGLNAAVNQLADRYQRLSEAQFYYFSDLGEKRFDAAFETNTYRIVQEALSNAFKYAQARHISVHIINQAQSLLIMVEDDGIGFEPLAKPQKEGGGYGLLNMRLRTEALQGRLLFDSTPGRGCVLNIELPLPPGWAEA